MAAGMTGTSIRPSHEAGLALLERAVAPAGSALPPVRLLVVLAHPDDEVLALGARLERLAESRILTLTDGAPRDGADARRHGFPSLAAYRAGREAELVAALAHAGLPASLAAPFPSIPAVADQEASRNLVRLTRGIGAVLATFAPEVVLTHPYEGGHPDHDACAFAVHTALYLRTGMLETHPPAPLLIEAPFYHADGHGGMRTGAFLDRPGAERWPAVTFTLSPEEQANKQARLACFPSQAETLCQFGRERELFRIAPRYCFTQPPHDGRLFYEFFSWGMTGERFRDLANEAQHQLFDTNGAVATTRRMDLPA